MTLQSVPLSSLQPPAANPRTVFDASSLEGLAASIRTDGLLQNLVVTPATKGRRNRESGYRIISGERRYRALKLLEERGDITGDYEIPVEIRTGLSKDDTLRLATIENLQREDLPPLDQATALAGLIRKGTTLDDIVAKTGLSASTIKRRLALNGLCAEVRSALLEGTVTLSQAEALTLGTHDAQRHLLEEIERGYNDCGPESIREHFLDGRPSVAMAIFPRERYTGTITTDLFQSEETSYFDDAEQFMALQQEAVAQLAEAHRAAAAFVEVTNHYRIPEWQYDEAEAGQPSGVVINLSPRGVVEIREGLVRIAQIDDDTAVRTSHSPVAAVKRKATYLTPLRRYIAWQKTIAVQEVLLAHPRKAKEISAVAQLTALEAHEALRQFAKHPEPQVSYTVIDTHAALTGKRLGLADDDASGWQSLTYAGGEIELYAAVKGLSDDELDQILLVLAVLPFGQVVCDRLDTRESLFNAVATDLQIDMRHHWRVDADFLNRRTRDQLIGIAQDSGYAEGLSGLNTWKKSELVNGILRHFEQARQASAPTAAQQKARAWLPEAMLFPAVDPDAADDVESSDDEALDAEGLDAGDECDAD